MGTESSFATGTRATCGLQQNKASWDLWVNITFNSSGPTQNMATDGWLRATGIYSHSSRSFQTSEVSVFTELHAF